MARKPKTKIFCIGSNKTGTTSMAFALMDLGFMVGDQHPAELLIDDWAKRDFRKLVKYCGSADAFQDVPFSLDFTYQVLDQTFPGSRFILTVRRSPQEWYDSLVRDHTRLMGKDSFPVAEDIKAFRHCELGWLWRYHQLVFGANETNLLERNLYMSVYAAHNRNVCEYFRHRPNDLLTLDVSEPEAMGKVCQFLDVPYEGQPMPHMNKTKTTETPPQMPKYFRFRLGSKSEAPR